MRDCGWLGAWCLVLGAWFSSIPSVSAAEEFVCWPFDAVGGRAKISGVFLDVAILVGAVFFAGGVFSAFVGSFFLLLRDCGWLGAWCLVLGAWCLVLGAWCLVLGAWCLVLGAWGFGLGA